MCHLLIQAGRLGTGQGVKGKACMCRVDVQVGSTCLVMHAIMRHYGQAHDTFDYTVLPALEAPECCWLCGEAGVAALVGSCVLVVQRGPS